MAIRVLMEREIEHGNENRLNQLLMELRSKALSAKGYVSGETLRLLDHPFTRADRSELERKVVDNGSSHHGESHEPGVTDVGYSILDY
jgi:hypothetical protein